MTRIYRKSSTGAAFHVNLNQVNVGWKKRSVSTNGLPRRIGGYTLRVFIHPTFFGSGSSGLGYAGTKMWIFRGAHLKMRHSLADTVTPREVWSWAMYDFANSGYTTAVITAIFNAYFVSVVADNQPWATFAWTAALAVSYAAIMITAPVIGASAAAYAAQQKLLALTTIGCGTF